VRQRYETSADIAEERRIAGILSERWGCAVIKLPLSYRLDYAGVRDGRILGWLEIKRRHRTFHQFATVFLSLQKVFAAHDFFRVVGCPCFYVVQFNDCLAYTDILADRPVEFRGRTDRDGQDQEPVVRISTGEFKVINAPLPMHDEGAQ
jgi:hypothetical protein